MEAQRLNLDLYASNLKPISTDLWVAATASPVSYSSDGNEVCLQLEDQSFWFQHRNSCIVAAFRNFPPEGIVFDVGGGNGYVSSALVNAGFSAVVVEPGLDGARNAVNRGLSPVVCSTFENAGFRSHALPAVGIFDVLEHIKNDREFLRSINKSLTANGRLYLTVPCFSFLWSFEDEEAGHFRRYTKRSLLKAIREAGFEVEYSSFIFGFLPIPIFFLRTLPYFFGFGKSQDIDKKKKEHQINGSGLLRGLIDAYLNWEKVKVQKRKALRFGGSLIVVARTNPIMSDERVAGHSRR